MTPNRPALSLSFASVAASLVLVSTAPAGAQSLGAVAREEAARRQTVAAGQVYTNANLPADAVSPTAAASPAAAAPAAQGAGAPSAAGTKAADAKDAAKKDDKKDEKKGEAYWRDRMKSLRDGKARAESFAEALQSRINALSTDFVNRDDPAQRNVIAGDRQKAIDELTRVQKEIADYTKSIDDLQTEARRAGVPAGWVR
jgi:hypothetical protein